MDSEKRIGIGLLGLGTVGCGVVKSLRTQADTIAMRSGCRPDVTHILVRDLNKPRAVQVDRDLLTTAMQDMIDDPGVEVIIEVIGGVDPAREYITRALLSGKHVITANKELLAKHGEELIAIARTAGVRLLFEASVAGGIPIVRMVEAYLTANRILSIRGILNGTCNYILTQMDERGQTFAEALLDAQQLGYAEADPESDIEGYDAAYKLCILANLAFPVQSPMSAVRRTGISAISPVDLRIAKSLGTSLKLIGQATYSAGRVQLEVGPRFLAQSDSLATVRDVFNAVTLTADVVGDLTFIGRGAGEMPTASAIIEDLMEVLRAPANGNGNALSVQRAAGLDSVLPVSGHKQVLYARLLVPTEDKAEQLAHLAALLLNNDSSLLFAAFASATGKRELLLVLDQADAETVALCASSLAGQCLFWAPFDGDVSAYRDTVAPLEVMTS